MDALPTGHQWYGMKWFHHCHCYNCCHQATLKA